MKQFTLINTYKAKPVHTCERCGKPIFGVYVVRDNLTNKTFEVGCSCIDKVLGIENNTIAKALQRKLKKIQEDLERINNWDINAKYLEKVKDGSYRNKPTNSLETISYNVTKRSNTRYEVYYSVVHRKKFMLYQLIKKLKDFKHKSLEIGLLENLEKEYRELDKLIDKIMTEKTLPFESEYVLADAEIEEDIQKQNAEKLKKIEEIKKSFYDIEGSKVELELELIEIEENQTKWGISYSYEFKMNNYNFIWKTNKDINVSVGNIVKLKGTIKENREYDEGNYTYLTRCKII